MNSVDCKVRPYIFAPVTNEVSLSILRQVRNDLDIKVWIEIWKVRRSVVDKTIDGDGIGREYMKKNMKSHRFLIFDKVEGSVWDNAYDITARKELINLTSARIYYAVRQSVWELTKKDNIK